MVDGKIANLDEYQDAWGFIETAKSMADGLIPDAITGQGNEIIAPAGAVELAAYGIW